MNQSDAGNSTIRRDVLQSTSNRTRMYIDVSFQLNIKKVSQLTKQIATILGHG